MADVGIVMPVYTQDSRLFRRAIRSILNQRYRNFKLLIVIDGVTPNVLQIARFYARRDKRVRVIPRNENQGTATALNVGFEILQSMPRIKYLTWVSSDNYYYRNFVGVLRNKLKYSSPNVGLAYGSFGLIRGGRRLDTTKTWLIWQDQPKERLVDFYFIGYSFMYKKEYSMQIAGWQYTPVEDYDFFLRLTEICDIVYVPKMLMDFMLTTPHSNSMQIENNIEKKRNRRYIMYHVMHQARLRRNISPLVTVILYGSEGSASFTQNLETLYESNISNYKVLLFDVTPNQSIIPIIADNPDSRTKYFWLPNATREQVIAEGLKQADTPYFMLYRTEEPLPDIYHLDKMLYSMPIANYDPASPQFLQLYHTGSAVPI
ncbi:glycosyltransferase involved in cell wall biosynthesis [Paenibacillus endophyticus]|uniref:Glycosyltransferase involved in cell wall biosynthesis n=1 Tax=Paenibacillus endophyticus TaxID=1294268 RepID=A0A7W5GC38_9BACL|nr:glycosyltransferase family 2 protein [Paenibacillus endophyticus]MBB3154959.1 glycosyltransferase involved in cell wall biosynthesis [Paenibacillus endophyticus]